MMQYVVRQTNARGILTIFFFIFQNFFFCVYAETEDVGGYCTYSLNGSDPIFLKKSTTAQYGYALTF